MHFKLKVSRCTCLILLVAAVALSTSTIAGEDKGLLAMPLAYVDPGSGQLVWQMVVAGCIGSLFYIKRIRTAIVTMVKKWFKKD